MIVFVIPVIFLIYTLEIATLTENELIIIYSGISITLISFFLIFFFLNSNTKNKLETVQLSKKLTRSEKLRSAIFDTAVVGISFVDKNRKIIIGKSLVDRKNRIFQGRTHGYDY